MTHPPIDFAKLPPIDRARFQRALFLGTARIGDGQYRVFDPLKPRVPHGENHHVDLYSNDTPRCDCGDHVYRELLCKHILACLLVERHPVAVQALVDHMAGK